MTKSNNDNARISRRAMLSGTALALGVGAVGATAMPAAAQQKLSQSAAKYQDTPKGEQSCAVCANFQPPNACKFVEGTINPKGWCMLFGPKT